MDQGLKEQVKTVIHALLVPHAKGLTVEKLCKEYAENEMSQIPFRTMGYDTLYSFLSAIPDTVRIIRLPSGLTLVQAVIKEGTSHIQKLVREQRNRKSGSLTYINRVLKSSDVPFHQRNSGTYRQAARQGGGVLSFERMQTWNSHPYNQPTFRQTTHDRYLFRGGTGDPVLDQQLKQQKNPPELNSKEIYEAQLVVDLIDLLSGFPNGVDYKHIGLMYFKKFQKSVDSNYIKEGTISLELYGKYHKHFNMQWVDGTFEISVHKSFQFQQTTAQKTQLSSRMLLQNGSSANTKNETNLKQQNEIEPNLPVIQETIPSVSNGQNSSTGTGAIPKTPRKHSPQAEEQIGKPQWQSIDVRTKSTRLETLEIPAEAPQNGISRQANSSSQPVSEKSAMQNGYQRQVVPISKLVSFPRKPRPFGSRGGEAETFGVRRPDVDDVCTPDTVIEHEDFPDVPENDFFFIIIAEVYSPGKFYWFLNQNRKQIERLTDDLGSFYTLHDEYVCSLNEMYIGQIVAAKYLDNLWYRAQVIGFRNGEFEMFYIDYGSSASVTIEKIRHLPLHFTQLPVQAFRGEIHGVTPISKVGQWSRESSKFFLDMIKNSKIIAACKMDEQNLLVTENKYETCYSLHLVDTNSDLDINLAHRLVEEKFAEIVDDIDWDNDASKQETNESALAPTAEKSTNSLAMTADRLAHDLKQRLTMLNGNNHAVVEESVVSKAKVAALDNAAIGTFSPSSHFRYPSTALRRVKRLELEDGRVFFIIKDDGKIYLTKYELLQLIPDIEQRMKASKMKLDLTLKESAKDRDLFFQCLTEGAPWMRDSQGNVIHSMEIFPLKDVPTVLFLFKRDKTASLAFEAAWKDVKDPYWEEAYTA